MRQQAVDGTYTDLGTNRVVRTLRAATRDPRPASVVVDKTLISLMLRGQKTQHRIPGIQDYEAGRIYAVKPAPGSPKRCDIEAIEVRVQQLGDVTYPEARAEGHRSCDEFIEHWLQRHGGETKLYELQVVTVLQFQLWADAPRLLTPGSKPRGDLGYTEEPSMAMQGEPEALSKGQLQHASAWRPALAEVRRREPLREQFDTLKLDLDAFQRELERNTDRQIRQSIRSMQHQLDNIQTRLGNTP